MNLKHYKPCSAAGMAIIGAAAMLLGCAAATAQGTVGTMSVAQTHPAVVTVERGFNKSCYNSIPVTVFVNRKPVSLLGVGQTITLHMVPGTYRVGVAMGGRGHARETPRAVTVGASTQAAAVLNVNLGPGGTMIHALHR